MDSRFPALAAPERFLPPTARQAVMPWRLWCPPGELLCLLAALGIVLAAG